MTDYFTKVDNLETIDHDIMYYIEVFISSFIWYIVQVQTCIICSNELLQNSIDEKEDEFINTYQTTPVDDHIENSVFSTSGTTFSQITYVEILEALEKLSMFCSQEPHMDTRPAEHVDEVLYWEKGDVEVRTVAARTHKPYSMISQFSLDKVGAVRWNNWDGRCEGRT